VTLFVDTSVWSLALRRDGRAQSPEVELLRQALDLTARDAIIERFAALPLLVPSRKDHVGAAGSRNACRRSGVQVGTIDARLAQLCIRHELTMLTTDADFMHMEAYCPLQVWRP
jgi:predicted nucleic acid-binding protein